MSDTPSISQSQENKLKAEESTDLHQYLRVAKLRDGRVARIRSIRSTDKLALLNGFHRLSKESIHARFFGGKHDLTVAELKYFTEVDFQTHVALVAELESDGTPVGVGRFIVNDSKGPVNANVAITVDEKHHGLGIGTILFGSLVEVARFLKIEEFSADIMTSNTHMIHIIDRLGLPVKKKETGGFINVRIFI